MSHGEITYRTVDGVAVITIDRPAKRNALTAAMCDALRDCWARVAQDDAVRAAVLTSAGDIFTAGADLTDPPPRFWEAVPNVGVPVSKPIITAVSGLVIGAGVTMVMMSDLCVAAENSKFIYPEAKVGVALGLIASIATRIPHKIAMEMVLMGEPIEAKRAYEAGLVNRVVPAGAHVDTALEMAKVIAANAPLVVGMLKDMLLDTTPRGPVEQMYRAQRAVDRVLQSEDAKEGPRAFREKRKPNFRGR